MDTMNKSQTAGLRGSSIFGEAFTPAISEDTISTFIETELERTTTPASFIYLHFISPNDTPGCLLYRYVVDCILNVCMVVIGFIGNTLSVMTMWRERNTSATAFLLITLAVADDLVLVVWAFQRAMPAIYAYHGWQTGMFLTYFAVIETYGWAVASVVHMLATWLMVLVTVQRYVAVCHPYIVHKVASIKAARIQVLVLVIVTVFYNVTRFLEVDHYWNESGTEMLKTRNALGTNALYVLLYKLILYYILIYVIPVLTLVFLTYKLIRHLSYLRNNTSLPSSARNKADLTAALVIVIIVFLICQLMNPVRRALASMTSPAEKKCGYFYYYFTSLSTLAINVNSASNFIIFCLCAPRFRKRFITIIFPRNRVFPFIGKTGEQRNGELDGSDTASSENAQNRTGNQTCETNDLL